jgi:hypothetical protein
MTEPIDESLYTTPRDAEHGTPTVARTISVGRFMVHYEPTPRLHDGNGGYRTPVLTLGFKERNSSFIRVQVQIPLTLFHAVVSDLVRMDKWINGDGDHNYRKSDTTPAKWLEYGNDE